MDSAAAIFRKIARVRRTCRRFVKDKPIPPDVLKDVMESTIVRALFLDCLSFFLPSF